MIAFAIYLAKVSVCIAAFYLLYASIFKNYTFFEFNRYYLVVGLSLSFVLPLLQFSWVDSYNIALPPSLEQSFLETEPGMHQFQTIDNITPFINYISLWPILYFAGFAVMLVRVVLSLSRINRIKNSSETCYYGKTKILRTKLSQPFSYFNLIFLPDRYVNPIILEHEKIHVRQFHWVDLIVMEIASVILWFNPMVLLYRRAVKIQHEYLADAGTVRQGIPFERYLECLLQQVSVENSLSHVSQFYSVSIKKRIRMITKEATSLKYSVTYLILIPVVGLLLTGFSIKPSSNYSDQIENDPVMQEEVSFVWPVDASKAEVVSGFGKRIHPMTGKEKFHTGIDLKSAEGNLVVSAAKGVVLESRSDWAWGNIIVVKHNEVYVTSYSHLKSRVVKTGDVLGAGQTIGYVGSTGLSTAPHLHYEVHKNGQPVDPKDYFSKID